MKYKTLALCGLIALLASCATHHMTQEQTDLLYELADRPITCKTEDDCEAKWNRAIAWVNDHSQTGIISISDKLIRTHVIYNTIFRARLRATEFTVIKYKQGDHYVMKFDCYCNHKMPCNPSGLQLQASFVTFVMGPPPGVTVHGESASKIVHKGTGYGG